MAADKISLSGLGLTRLAGLGLDVDKILSQAGISPSFRHQSKVSLTTRQYFALWCAIREVSGDALIGLRIGGEPRPDKLDPASFAALHSETFGEALARLARYKRLSCPEEINIVQFGGQTSISFHWLCAQELAPSILTDAAFANIHLLLQFGTGKPISPLRIEVSRRLDDATGELHAYQRHFGCDVRGGAEQDALIYPNETLGERFVTGNPDLIAALLPGLDQQLDAELPQSFDRQVKAVLTKIMQGERPSIDVVARHLFVSPRTLQRRLTEANTNYQTILDEARLDVALKLLGNTQMEPGEIAFYLGYEEVNSFLRAFNRWQGVTPTQWRVIASNNAA